MKINLNALKIDPALKLSRRKENRRRLKHGSYSMILTAVVIAGTVALNLLVSELPSKYTQIDLTGQQLSTLSTQSEEILSALTEDVTLYYIVEDSSKDTNISRLLERYGDFSHVTVVEKDPVLYPNFTSQYTDATVSDNSVIAVCGDVSRVISYDSMYESELNYTYYSYETTGFDAEGQITSAIAAVTSDGLPKLYTLTGHGELEINDTLAQSIEKENIDTESLNLVTSDAVPEDADCLLIASPTSDLSEGEATKVLNYLRTGGKAIVVTDYTTEEMPNLQSILEYYGVSTVDGIVIEGDSNYFVQVPYYLVPDINSTDVSSDMTGGSNYVLLAAAQGLETSSELRDGVSVTSVLSSSSSSYSKTDVQNLKTYEKESGDIDGAFDLGVLITETVELTDELLAKVNETGDEAELTDALGTLNAAESDTETADESSADTEKESELSSAADAEGESELSAAAEDTTEAESESDTEAEAIDPSENETAETKLAVYTSSTLMDASADQMVSGGNSKLFINTLSWMCGHENSVSVPVKSMSVDYLTLTSASSSFWSIIVIGIIPGAFLLGGLFIWLSRRKR